MTQIWLGTRLGGVDAYGPGAPGLKGTAMTRVTPKLPDTTLH
jgi:hypothetical protein